MNIFSKNRISLLTTIFIISLPIQAKTLVYCSEGSPEIFNPQLSASLTTYDASSVQIYNRLIEFKLGTTEIEPALAESWEISNDGKIYTFYLRKGVKWHSNREFKPTRDFNADDVIYSFMRQKDPTHPYHKVSGGNYEYFMGMDMDNLISKLEKVDDYTIRITLSHFESPFLSNLGMDFASILSAEYAEKMLAAGTPEKVDLNPIGTGPFELQYYQKDSQIRYKSHNNYWKEKPKIDNLIFSITPDASIRYAKLQKNECQIMAYPHPADLERMAKNKNIILMSSPGLNVGYLAFNVNKKPLDSKVIRQALALAVNKDAIIEAIYQGSGQKAKNLIPPIVWSYNDEIKDYEYNPQKAKSILVENGFTNGFEIDLWAMPLQRPYNPNPRRMAEMIQADWAKIGIKSKIVSYEWGEYLKRAKNGEPQTVMMGWTGDNGDPDNFLAILFSCAAKDRGTNYSKWCYKDYDDLILAARTTDDINKRIELYKQAQVIMHEQVPALIIAHSTVFKPIRKEVSGYIIDPFGKNHFSNVDIK
ncbi:ABC transporter substrate-binding protein [Providencia rettgeri]